jgi:hypothetical protein
MGASPDCRRPAGGCSNDEAFFFSAFNDGGEGTVDKSNSAQLKDCKSEKKRVHEHLLHGLWKY